MKNVFKKFRSLELVIQILIGLVVGIIIGFIASVVGGTFAVVTSPITVLGSLFVGALKGIAPVIVFFLVLKAISHQKEGSQSNMKRVIFLYLTATFCAALVAVLISFAFPTEIILQSSPDTITEAPETLVEILANILTGIVQNPIGAIVDANYLSVLFWAVLMGIGLRKASSNTKTFVGDIAGSLQKIVEWIISFAPFGIMGLVYQTVATEGIASLLTYLDIIGLLLAAMFIQALIINPIIVYFHLKTNPYPIVFKCLTRSGITAFFTRSSAANIPVNLELCEDMGVDPETYDVSIPLGATINMSGAAITINVLTLAAAYTLGIDVTLPTAIVLSVIAAVSACGASGVAGGSLLLIPLACSLLGIDNDTAFQVVQVGFTISVIQDSVETALNSS